LNIPNTRAQTNGTEGQSPMFFYLEIIRKSMNGAAQSPKS